MKTDRQISMEIRRKKRKLSKHEKLGHGSCHREQICSHFRTSIDNGIRLALLRKELDSTHKNRKIIFLSQTFSQTVMCKKRN